jgi:hypothetical protein
MPCLLDAIYSPAISHIITSGGRPDLSDLKCRKLFQAELKTSQVLGLKQRDRQSEWMSQQVERVSYPAEVCECMVAVQQGVRYGVGALDVAVDGGHGWLDPNARGS